MYFCEPRVEHEIPSYMTYQIFNTGDIFLTKCSKVKNVKVQKPVLLARYIFICGMVSICIFLDQLLFR